jgi:hypothetical protein
MYALYDISLAEREIIEANKGCRHRNEKFHLEAK